MLLFISSFSAHHFLSSFLLYVLRGRLFEQAAQEGQRRENKIRLPERTFKQPGERLVSKPGGDGRIRTYDGLLTHNGLANRRLQPLGHISTLSDETKEIF